jgi:hypothetical protein
MRKNLMLVCALAGCTSTWQRTVTTTQPGKIVRVSLESTEGRTCADRCTALGGDGDAAAVMSCLAACPGSEQRVGRCGPADRLPDAICVAAPESQASVDEAGRCTERMPAPHSTCDEREGYHADGRVWLWMLSMLAVIPVVAFENR